MTAFIEMLKMKWDEGKFVCVGLDSDINFSGFPTINQDHQWIKGKFRLGDEAMAQLSFNCSIIDATHDIACAFKPNLAFYYGDMGKRVLLLTIAYAHFKAPGAPIILDAKQADIGNTNNGYVHEDFVFYGADAVTVHPYLGMEAMKPFLDQTDKGVIVLCKTSNPGSGEFQNQQILSPDSSQKLSMYHLVAQNVSQNWNYNGNCCLVVGATYPEELAEVRQIVGDLPILIPGIGAQGGDLEATVRAGRDSKNQGMIINSSRGIIFASSGEDFAEAARAETQKLHDAINACLAGLN